MFTFGKRVQLLRLAKIANFRRKMGIFAPKSIHFFRPSYPRTSPATSPLIHTHTAFRIHPPSHHIYAFSTTPIIYTATPRNIRHPTKCINKPRMRTLDCQPQKYSACSIIYRSSNILSIHRNALLEISNTVSSTIIFTKTFIFHSFFRSTSFITSSRVGILPFVVSITTRHVHACAQASSIADNNTSALILLIIWAL